jgi:hypothetical protein
MPSLNISKIALIQQSENCFLADKLIYAEMEGAVAALVFNDGSYNQSNGTKVYNKKNLATILMITWFFFSSFSRLGCHAKDSPYSCVLY